MKNSNINPEHVCPHQHIDGSVLCFSRADSKPPVEPTQTLPFEPTRALWTAIISPGIKGKLRPGVLILESFPVQVGCRYPVTFQSDVWNCGYHG